MLQCVCVQLLQASGEGLQCLLPSEGIFLCYFLKQLLAFGVDIRRDGGKQGCTMLLRCGAEELCSPRSRQGLVGFWHELLW